MTSSGTTLPPYINGRFVDIARPDGNLVCANPAKPTDILAVTSWSKGFTEEILAGLKTAQRDFQMRSLDERLAMVGKLVNTIRESAEELKSQMMLELARSRYTVEEEWRLCEALFSLLPVYCRQALSEKSNANGWTWTPAPVGLVLISSNVALPVYTLLSSLLPALVAGNAVVMKPSSHCPLSASLLASCIHQCSFPAGLVQVIYGDFDVYRRLLLTHQFDVVLYCGGEEKREQIRKDLSTYQNTRLVMCGAGKNMAYVSESAHLDDAIARILYGSCADAGQRLEATGLAFVHESRAQEFTEKFVKAVKSMPIGAREDLTLSTHHVMGPVCSAGARERFLRFQGIAYREAEETLRWGKSIDNPGNGYFVSPGVHFMRSENVVKSVYASSASFGPDVCIVPVTGVEEVVRLADTLECGHILSVHSQDENEVRQIRQLSDMPMVYWNRPTTDLDPDLPLVGRGHSDTAHGSGLGFLFSTIFSKTLVTTTAKATKILTAALAVLAGAALWTGVQPSQAHAEYKNSVEGNEVVKGKLYPRAGRLQINAPQAGMILNQSFINTYLISGSLSYHLNEWHAFGVEGFFGVSSDRNERKCIESFFFNEERAARAGANAGPCDPDNAYNAAQASGADEQMPSNYKDPVEWEKERNRAGPFQRKPAYMPIRQIDQMYGLNYQWTPVYGKALWFMSAVGYLDVYFNFGLGVAMSTYWPRLATTKVSNEDIKTKGTNDVHQYGVEGRPDPVKQTSPQFSGGLGSRFFFGRIASRKSESPAAEFLANVELRNFTVVGSDPNGDSGLMNFFGLWGGLGVMF